MGKNIILNRSEKLLSVVFRLLDSTLSTAEGCLSLLVSGHNFDWDSEIFMAHTLVSRWVEIVNIKCLNDKELFKVTILFLFPRSNLVFWASIWEVRAWLNLPEKSVCLEGWTEPNTLIKIWSILCCATKSPSTVQVDSKGSCTWSRVRKSSWVDSWRN